MEKGWLTCEGLILGSEGFIDKIKREMKESRRLKKTVQDMELELLSEE